MIPSLLQIPSAVSDSKLHSVLPNNGKGDFQFERSTGATRINKDGLIEEVGYFSSELVQNGNFSELGSDVVVNGDFATDSDWNKGTGWSIINGAAIREGLNSYSNIKQDGILTVGKTYKVTYTVNQGAVNGVRVNIGGVYYGDYYGVGTHTVYGKATNNADLFLMAEPLFQGSIDNVSVKQVDPNDRWSLVDTKFTGANTFENTATNGRIFQSFTTIVGSKYKVSFTLNSGTWNIYASTNNNSSGQIVSTGQTTASGFFEFTATGTTTFLVLYNIGASGSVASITDASVVEVQGDRPRLSYDITNGVVEDQPHLLLEPSSTNVFTFSNFFGSGALEIYSNGTQTHTVTNNYSISPDGTKNAIRLQATVGSSSSDRVVLRDLVTAGATTFTFSVYAKSNTTDNVTLGFHSGGGTPSTFVATPNWKRFTYTATLTATSNVGVEVRGGQTSSNVDVSLFGYQLEQQSYVTSYIPTAGTTITRAAETCNNSKPSVNSTEGVLYCEIQALSNDLSNRRLSISDGSDTNRINMMYTAVSNQIVANYRVSGSTVVSLTSTANSITNYNKVAFNFKSGDFKLFINGTEVATSTNTTMMAANTLNLVRFEDPTGSNDFYGKVKGLAVYNEALTDAQLIELTS